jgi:hypothetical protein
MRKFWHAIGFHKWTRWSDPRQGLSKILWWDWDEVQVQERHCEICNIQELRHAQ